MIRKAENSRIRAANASLRDSFRYAAPPEDPPTLSRVERLILRQAQAGSYKLFGLMPDAAAYPSLRR